MPSIADRDHAGAIPHEKAPNADSAPADEWRIGYSGTQNNRICVRRDGAGRHG